MPALSFFFIKICIQGMGQSLLFFKKKLFTDHFTFLSLQKPLNS